MVWNFNETRGEFDSKKLKDDGTSRFYLLTQKGRKNGCLDEVQNFEKYENHDFTLKRLNMSRGISKSQCLGHARWDFLAVSVIVANQVIERKN